jgi:ribulose-5-phosphate 4-epimerase/fuculose-1-phosphate aldolase
MAYHGVKFKTNILGEAYPIPENIEELASWCNCFAQNGLAPTHSGGTYGNLSIRVKDGIVISATSLDLSKKLQASDFVYVNSCNYESFEMTVFGNRPPSSETPIHWSLYTLRPEINAVFHGHHDDLLRLSTELSIPETESEQAYGSISLVHEIIKLANYDFFNMKNHGFISVGKTMKEAGELALKQLEKLNIEY